MPKIVWLSHDRGIYLRVSRHLFYVWTWRPVGSKWQWPALGHQVDD